MHNNPTHSDMPPNPTGKKTNLRDIAVEQIRSLITSENMQKGQRLPPERMLSKRFAVSRHLVREALRILEQQQVIISRIGSGSYVETPNPTGLGNILTEKALRERSNLLEILEFRRTLEPRIAYLAASRVTQDNAAEMQHILTTMRAAMFEHKLPEWQKGDAAFHSLLADMTGNFLYQKTISLLLQAMVSFKNSPMLEEQMRASQAAHETIARHILTGNGEKAATTMESHVVTAVHTALETLPTSC